MSEETAAKKLADGIIDQAEVCPEERFIEALKATDSSLELRLVVTAEMRRKGILPKHLFPVHATQPHGGGIIERQELMDALLFLVLAKITEWRVDEFVA